MPSPLQVDNIFVFIRQVAVVFRHNNIFVFIRKVAPVPGMLAIQDISNKLTFDLLTLKVVSVPILVFLGLSVVELRPMYATDVRQKHRLMPPPSGAEA